MQVFGQNEEYRPTWQLPEKPKGFRQDEGFRRKWGGVPAKMKGFGKHEGFRQNEGLRRK